MSLAAGERLAAPEPPPRWQPWALAAALLLHVLAIALALYTRERGLPQDQESPPGIAMVFDKGGAPQTTAPPAQLRGPPETAQIPPPPPPPPPQPQTEVNLNMPLSPLAALPQPQPHPQPAPRPRPAPPQHYAMMLDGMSYGNPSPVAPAPPAKQALNLELPQSDAQAVFAPELTIKGDAGADWDAALNRWVEAHKYYPQAAAEQGQQGSVEIEFVVDRQGNVTGLRMLNGSGSTFLDQAWLGLFQDAQLPAFPPGTKSDHITVDATMHYELIQ
jgi:protein TonB